VGNRRPHAEDEVRTSYTHTFLAVLEVIILTLLLVISPWAGLAGTRAQSDDRCGSGMLRSRQVLRGSLPLLSPAFRRSHLRHQMPPCSHQRERS
jgi:hypothetical protein